MAITRGPVSTPAVNGSATVINTAWSVNPAAGSKVLVAVQFGAAASFLTVTDNGTSPVTFTLDGTSAGSGTASAVYIYRADAITAPGAGSYTVTVTSTDTAHTMQAVGVAYTGVKTGGPTASNNPNGSGSSVSTGNATPAAAGALYFATFFDDTSSASETITLTGSGFTEQFTQVNGSSFWAGGVADKIDSGGPTATACTWTLGDTPNWNALIAAYDAIPAPGAPFRQATRPARAPAPRAFSKGRVTRNAGAPLRNPAQGPVFRQAVRAVQARIPKTFSKGRGYQGNPGAPVHNPVPPTPGPVFYPKNSQARFHPVLPPRGRAAGNRGTRPVNPTLGPVFRQAVKPVQAVIPQRTAGGRVGSNPGGPVQDPQGWYFTGPVGLTYLQYLEPGGTLVGIADSTDVVPGIGVASGWMYNLPVPPPDGRWVPAAGGPGFIVQERAPEEPAEDDLSWDPPPQLAHLPVPFGLVARRIMRKQQREEP